MPSVWYILGLLASSVHVQALNKTTNKVIDIDLIAVPDYNQHALSSRSDGTLAGRTITDHDLSLFGVQKVYYAVPIVVRGWTHPTPELLVKIDTGSDLVWFYGSQCQGCKPGWEGRLFNDNIQGQETTITYEDHEHVKGVKTANMLHLPPLGHPTNVPFIVARETTVRLRDNVMGMLGLGPPRRPSNVLPWYHLVPGGIKSFGIYLAGRDGGKLTIGGANHDCKEGDLVTMNVVSRAGSVPMWRIPFASFTVGDREATLGTSVELDTGASIGIGEADLVQQLYIDVFGLDSCEKTRYGDHYTVCGNILQSHLTAARRKRVTFTFGEGDTTITIEIDPKSLLHGLGEDKYIGNIALKASLPRIRQPWLLGNPHMTNMYVVHTINADGTATVGLAPPAPQENCL